MPGPAKAALLRAVGALLLAFSGGCVERNARGTSDASHAPAGAAAGIRAAERRLAELERASGGRLGVALRDREGRVLLDHRGEERFAMCSTFKPLLAAMVLADAGGLAPDNRLPIESAQMHGHAPFTRQRAQQGWMSVADATENIVTVSDNYATNLLLTEIGGPAGLTAWLRGLGDEVTRLDRDEPTLNENTAGDPRDTSSPLAFGETYHRLLNRDVLSAGARASLSAWLMASRTGLDRLRAGLPGDWRVGDKTGYCAKPGAVAVNDVAVFDPDGSGWYTLVFFLDRPTEAGSFADRIGAELGAIAAAIVDPDASGPDQSR